MLFLQITTSISKPLKCALSFIPSRLIVSRYITAGKYLNLGKGRSEAFLKFSVSKYYFPPQGTGSQPRETVGQPRAHVCRRLSVVGQYGWYSEGCYGKRKKNICCVEVPRPQGWDGHFLKIEPSHEVS